MKLTINWQNPVIAPEEVLHIQPADLDDFYFGATEPDKTNLFFVLLNSLHSYEAQRDFVRAAHLSFLAANYLFIALTPPGSYDLALHYMKKAIRLHPAEVYSHWLSLMEKGN